MHFCIKIIHNCIERFLMEGMDKMKSKAELSSEIWKRIQRGLDNKKISQVQLSSLCEEHGFHISQPEISRLYAGKANLTLYQLTAFAEILSVSSDYLIYGMENEGLLKVKDHSFIIDPSNEAFEGCLGTYHTMFYSTSRFEEKPIFGKLCFHPSRTQNICKAEFELRTGEKDLEGNDIYKRYTGQLVISPRLNIAYCILKNEKIGEISFLEFRHRNFFVRSMECRMVMVLTVSAGEVKVPVHQRMFITRQVFTEEMVELITPYLKIAENEEILINRKNFEALVKKEGKLGIDFTELLEISEVEEYIRLDEGEIRKIYRKLGRIESARILSALLGCSETSFLTCMEEADDSRAYDLIRGCGEGG